jgi:hypothetical protein
MDSNPIDTASQEANHEQVKLRDRLAALSEVDDIKWLMGSRRGRRIVHRLRESAGVFRISFHTNAL